MSISIEHVSKQFGTFQALSDVNLQIASGELVALLGPSGCGKTTLLRIIAGLETADQGNILFAGIDATDVHPRERNVGFVFQHYALFRHMTVFENVAFGLRMKPRSIRPTEKAIKDKVHQLLNLVQLDWRGDRYPAQLSGGQRQRIALARALAVEPQVLLLDEPFGALDAKVRKELRRWLRRLHDELHVSSVFVTHDQEEALEVSDRVVLMNHGKVEQVGTPQEIWENPANAFVSKFLGEVNQFKGTVAGDAVRLGQSSVTVPLGQSNASNVNIAHVFVRPHEIDIGPVSLLNATPSAPYLAATLLRAVNVGPVVRLELEMQDRSLLEEGQFVEVHLGIEKFKELGLQVGQPAGLSIRKSRVYLN